MFTAFLQLLLDILVTYYLAKGMADKRMPWLVFMYVFFLPKATRLLNSGSRRFVMGHLLIKYVRTSCG